MGESGDVNLLVQADEGHSGMGIRYLNEFALHYTSQGEVTVVRIECAGSPDMYLELHRASMFSVLPNM